MKGEFSVVWGEAKKYWLFYIGLMILGPAIGFAIESLNGPAKIIGSLLFFVLNLGIGLTSVSLLFFIAYSLAKKRIPLKCILVFGLVLNVIFSLLTIIVPLINNTIRQNTMPTDYLKPAIFLILLFVVVFNGVIIIAGYFVGKGEKTQSNTEVSLKKNILFAGFLHRLIARAIDCALLWLILIAIIIALKVLSVPLNSDNPTWVGIFFVWLAFGEIYFIYFHKVTGQTIGKKLMHLKLVKTDLSGLTWKDSILRWFIYKMSFLTLFVSVLWIAFDQKKQGWHDKIAGTYVVHESDTRKGDL